MRRQRLSRTRQLVERRMKRAALARAFYGWMIVRQEACSGRERVRQCVAGQRIAFQCFDQWYQNQLGDTAQQVRLPTLIRPEEIGV